MSRNEVRRLENLPPIPGGDTYTVQSALGLAASAASFIAMAGDEIQIARAGFMMIHNAWTVAAGDRNDFTEVADFLDQIDGTLADIYSVRTGDEVAAMRALMDVETWMGGSAAVEAGFADGLLPSDAAQEDPQAKAPHQIAARRLDAILAKQGMPRSERRSLIQELKGGTPGAAPSGTRSAAEPPADLATHFADLQAAMSRFSAAALK